MRHQVQQQLERYGGFNMDKTSAGDGMVGRGTGLAINIPAYRLMNARVFDRYDRRNGLNSKYCGNIEKCRTQVVVLSDSEPFNMSPIDRITEVLTT